MQRLSNSPMPGAWPLRAIGATGSALSVAVDRLAVAPPALRLGWLVHMLLEEASVLDAIVVDADEPRLQAVGTLATDAESAVEGVERVALDAGILRLLRAVTARHPRQLFTANRLAACASKADPARSPSASCRSACRPA